MKKLFLSLAVFLSVGQCSANNDSYTKLLQVYQMVQGQNATDLSRDKIDNFLVQFNKVVVDETELAIKKSVNIFGKKDNALIGSAMALRGIALKILNLYKGIAVHANALKMNGRLKSDYQTGLSRIEDEIGKELVKINKKFHVDVSKRSAQQILKGIAEGLKATMIRRIILDLRFIGFM